MPIRLYNSLVRKKEEFIPLKPPQVNIYTCGVTVYDESHIGHARSLYVFDLIRRYLIYRGFRVRFVRNITDIDDKIINRANELKISWQELVQKYIGRYHEDLASLNIEKADFEPRASENIPEMIKSIQGLIEKGYAYVAAGDVYFSVRKFPSYGRLSGQGISEMESGARLEHSDLKKDPLDFALWKGAKPLEPHWPSPWGEGRPGWHIECSVMSQKFLQTDTLDIHAGGRDLIFPHHENEIAQAEALSKKPFAKYWMHHGLLTMGGEKMAKSLGNFISIRDFLAKYKNADLLKLFFLSTHYSHPIDYSAEKIEEVRQALERIHILLEKINRELSVVSPSTRLGTDAKRSRTVSCQLSDKKIGEIEEMKNKFIAAMDDDFNTAEALGVVFELVSLTNKNIEDLDFIFAAQGTLKELLGILGISLKVSAQVAAVTDAEIKAKILEREKARQAKNYLLADALRKELEASGVILEDEKGGTSWRRKL